MSNTKSPNITGVILAGGQSRRMGTDKAFIDLNGKSMLGHIVDIVFPQVDRLIINCNSDDGRYRAFNCDVVSDSVAGCLGPLAGILTGMENADGALAVFTAPVDCPLLPSDLVKRLARVMFDSETKCDVDIVRVRSNGRHHPVIALWKVHLLNDLKTAIIDNNIRKVDHFTKNYTIVDIDFDDSDVDVFFNINREDDIAQYKSFKKQI